MEPGIVLVMNNGNDGAQDRAWTGCLWFIKRGVRWSRHTERVQQVCRSQPEIRRALPDTGFGPVRTRDSTPFFKGNPIVERGCRTAYLARKERTAAAC